MTRGRLLSAALIAVIAALGAVGGYYLGLGQASQPGYHTAPYDGHAMRVELYVYRNGELVYYDPDDPAVNNMLYLLAEIIAGNVVSGFKSVDGLVANRIANSNYAGTVFLNYDSSYTYSASMTGLPALYDSGTISSGGVTFDENTRSVLLSASVNVQQNATVYGVGIYTTLQVGTSGSNYVYNKNFLLFYDQLEMPFNVTSGDVVTVVYKFTFP